MKLGALCLRGFCNRILDLLKIVTQAAMEKTRLFTYTKCLHCWQMTANMVNSQTYFGELHAASKVWKNDKGSNWKSTDLNSLQSSFRNAAIKNIRPSNIVLGTVLKKLVQNSFYVVTSSHKLAIWCFVWSPRITHKTGSVREKPKDSEKIAQDA